MTLPSGRTYTPLNAKFPMSWPARECNWCGDEEMTWAYPLGPVIFPRVDPNSGDEIEVPHHAQLWYCCARCKTYIDRGLLDELADLLGKPRGYWNPLAEARLKKHSSGAGFPWRRRVAV
ncbi:hypothetical protein AB0E08_08280 [Streptomyces sp. NPDC048281]|uniref:hypothetical protein n=1 Tax=Streptomyces sp. NPDC048281 TaxID=3154715 RepID=UPI003426322C